MKRFLIDQLANRCACGRSALGTVRCVATSQSSGLLQVMRIHQDGFSQTLMRRWLDPHDQNLWEVARHQEWKVPGLYRSERMDVTNDAFYPKETNPVTDTVIRIG